MLNSVMLTTKANFIETTIHASYNRAPLSDVNIDIGTIQYQHLYYNIINCGHDSCWFSYNPQAPTAGSKMEFTVKLISASQVKLYVEFEEGEKCYIGFENNGHAVKDACSEPPTAKSKQNVLWLDRV